MSLTPPLLAHKELIPLSSEPRLDLAFTRQEGGMDKAQALLNLTSLESGFLIKRTASNQWFWSFLFASLCLHAALLLASSLWERQNETAFGEEPIAVELILEPESPQVKALNSEPSLNLATEHDLIPAMLIAEIKNDNVLEKTPSEPILSPEPVPQENSLQEEPAPAMQEAIKQEEFKAIEPPPVLAERLPMPSPPAQAAKPTAARKLAQAATPIHAPALTQSQLTDFRDKLSRKLASAFHYPPLARERNKTGTVSVTFEIDAKGNVSKAVVLQSSGYDELDDDALATIRRAAPFEPPPSGAPRSFTFPIVYRLR